MADNVWDNHTGKHLLSIDNDQVVCLQSGRCIADVMGANLYAKDGSLICYLQDVPVGYGSKKPMPDRLKALINGDSDP